MSVVKNCCAGMLMVVGLLAYSTAHAQDFDSLLQDLTLPSPTTLSATAEGQATEPAAMAAEEPVNSDDFFFGGSDAETNTDAASTVESDVAPAVEAASAVESAPVVSEEPEVAAEPADDFFADDTNVQAASAVESAPVPEVAEEPQPVAAMEESAPVADEVAPAPAPAATSSFDDLFGDATAPTGAEVDAITEPSLFEAAEPAATSSNEFDSFADQSAGDEATEVSELEPVPVAEAPIAITPETTGLSPKLIAQQEEVRRQASEVEGRQAAERGLTALREGRFDAAAAALTEAQEKLPNRSANRALLQEVNSGIAQAYSSKADQMLEQGNLKASREALTKAKAAGADISQTDRKLTRAEERDAATKARPVPVRKRPEIVDRQKTVAELIREGRQYFDVRDYNSAEALFEQVLQKDEYNVDAMHFLRRIDEVRYKIRSQEREATAAELIQKVRDGWNPPIRGETVAPQAVVNRGAVETQTSAQRLQEKMEKIIIPSIEFRQANINDVVNFLVEASISGDPERTGVNIILNLNTPGSDAASAPAPVAAPAAVQDFGFGDFGSDFGVPAPAQDFASPAPSSNVPTITLNLRRISLLDAIKYITEVARLKFRLEENAVMITPEGVVSGRVVTRLYPVQPSILDVIVERDEPAQQQGGFQELGAKSTTFKKSDVKDFFEKTGVPFPAGTSITYNPTISQLIVANTPENLEVFERILARLNVIPNQVEIEARFVEISQDDLEELGFQWLLTDNWEIAQQTGPGGAAAAQRFQMNADAQGVTKGLRFFGRNATTGSLEPATPQQFGANIANMGGIATFASVLTNPEVSLIVQALSQHGGTDLLSAPRVTTRSGVNAQIQVVREIIYPTEFETTQPQFNDSGNVTTPPVVTPGTFEKRETGVILNVTPTVGPDGYTIDLVMVPEVSELVDWIQYGSTITLPRTDPITGLFAGDQVFTFNIPQPIFSSRNVTTSIVIWDGQTVVMGGLIREDLIKVKDKIPGLGDIPLIGRLFRSEGEYSRKRNLLIFVTARLVDPAGKPINRGDALATVEGAPAQATP